MPLKGPAFLAEARGNWDLLMSLGRSPREERVTLRDDGNGVMSSAKVLDETQKK